MEKLIYGLCTLSAILCAWLLLRSFFRTRVRLLLWSGLCFSCYALNNALLIVDRIILPDVDLSTPRLAMALVAVMLLVTGLVLESDQ